MISKILKAIAFLLVLSTLAYSQVVEMEGKSLPYLNQQLRETIRRLNTTESWTVNSLSGILDLDSGGTGASLSDPGGDYLMIWDDSDGAVELTMEASTDTALGGNSDVAIPTEKAVKTYIDTGIDAVKADIQSDSEQSGAGGGNSSWGTVDSFTETVTSGNKVLVIACFYLTGTVDVSGEQIRLYDGAASLSTVTPKADGWFCLQGVDTDGSGSTTYSLQGYATTEDVLAFADVNLTVIEFGQ